MVITESRQTFPAKVSFLTVPFHNVGLERAVEIIAKRAADKPFGYLVTPNVDHVVRLNREPLPLGQFYDQAALCLNDSRILRRLAMLVGVNLPLAAGSDLTMRLFEDIIQADEPITIIGCDRETLDRLKVRYNLKNVNHHNPPMGFANVPVEVDKCVEYIENHPSRFVFLAVGSPRQELVAYKALKNSQATGLGLCIGASLHFLAGTEMRAPVFMQRLGLEWLFRLLSNPKKLWKRYLLDCPMIFKFFISQYFGSHKK